MVVKKKEKRKIPFFSFFGYTHSHRFLSYNKRRSFGKDEFGNRIASSTWSREYIEEEESFFLSFLLSEEETTKVYFHHHLHLPQSVQSYFSDAPTLDDYIGGPFPLLFLSLPDALALNTRLTQQPENQGGERKKKK
jgi:hypothetical protein